MWTVTGGAAYGSPPAGVPPVVGAPADPSQKPPVDYSAYYSAYGERRIKDCLL